MANWQGVTEFVSVAESKSFTAAAQKLATSTAQISRKVSGLESRLGVKLLNRTTRMVTLTEAGRVYFQQCQPLIEGLALAELTLSQMQLVPQGILKITAPVTYGERHLAPLLNQFLADYPQLELELILTNRKLDLLESGIDLAIRLGRLQDSRMIARRLADRQLYLCASPAYLERFGEPHSLSELSHHQCLVGSVNYWRFQEQGTERSLRISGRIKCNSGYALCDAAMRGLGLVQLPDYYVGQALKDGALVEVLPQYRDLKEGIWALYPENRNLSPKVRLLLDYLSEQLVN